MERRSLRELLSPEDGWDQLAAWMTDATTPIEFLASDRTAGEATLVGMQVTTRSLLGTIAYRAGGLLIDHGWVRILGSGHPRVGGGLREWNQSLGGPALDPPLDKALLVAYDAVGGFFALNGGNWDSEPGSVHYFAPDTCAWEPMGYGYSGLLTMLFSKQIAVYYEPSRWLGWESEVESLGPDQVLAVYPSLPFGGPDGGPIPIEQRSRYPVPARELWTFEHDLGRQLAEIAPGSRVQIKVLD